MTEADKQLVKECLALVDDGLSRLMDIPDERVKSIANILHGVIVLGEKL